MGSTSDSNNIMIQGQKNKNAINLQQNDIPMASAGENNSYVNQTYNNKNKAVDGGSYFNRPGNNSS